MVLLGFRLLSLAVLILGWTNRRAESVDDQFGSDSPWTWICDEKELCSRMAKNDLDPSEYQTLAACSLTCGKYGGLWPKPTGETIISKFVVPFLPENVTFLTPFDTSPEDNELRIATYAARDIFLDIIKRYYPWNIEQKPEGEALGNRVEIIIRFESPSLDLNLFTPEDYVLSLTRYENVSRAQILSQTFYGARHALETLSQLIAYDELHDSLQILESAMIIDGPVFPFRGVMLDTSRNYYNIDTLKRFVDGLSRNKLNVFHWHLTDSQSFPICLDSRPKFCQYGAYAPWKVYRAAEVKEIVEYSRVRGVRVIPEIDVPTHVGEGWQWAIEEDLGNLTLCIRIEPWEKYCLQPPCGVVNPVNDKLYEVLEDVYGDLLQMFDTDIIHMGGDEVVLQCWNESEEVKSWMSENNYTGFTENDFLRLWGEKFQSSAATAMKNANSGANKTMLLWASHLTGPGALTQYLNPDDYIIHVWEDMTVEKNKEHLKHMLENGFKIIVSNVEASYLDCGYGHWLGPPEKLNWCAPYKSWQAFYENDFLKISLELTADEIDPEVVKDLVLGGESIIWTETVHDHSLDGKVWPRSAAAAERYWSNPEGTWMDVEWRLTHQTERLAQFGIRTDAIRPEWCHQNSALCYLKNSTLPERQIST